MQCNSITVQTTKVETEIIEFPYFSHILIFDLLQKRRVESCEALSGPEGRGGSMGGTGVDRRLGRRFNPGIRVRHMSLKAEHSMTQCAMMDDVSAIQQMTRGGGGGKSKTK